VRITQTISFIILFELEKFWMKMRMGTMSRIDVEGLEPPTKTLLAEDLHYLIKQFEELNWAGKHLGGYPVLGSFSKRDKIQVKPTISFHLNAQRSALYACGDWAGGETLRAVRHSVLDLLSLRNDIATQEDFFDYLRESVPSNALISGEQYIRTAKEKIPHISNKLAERFRIAFDAKKQFEFGVVYMFEIPINFFKEYFWCDHLEFRTSEAVPCDFITGKYILKSEHSSLPADCLADYR
jgi:hypothetical protein